MICNQCGIFVRSSSEEISFKLNIVVYGEGHGGKQDMNTLITAQWKQARHFLIRAQFVY